MKCCICNDTESISLPTILYNANGAIVSLSTANKTYPCPECVGTFFEGYMKGYKDSANSARNKFSDLIEKEKNLSRQFFDRLSEFQSSGIDDDATPEYWNESYDTFVSRIKKKYFEKE